MKGLEKIYKYAVISFCNFPAHSPSPFLCVKFSDDFQTAVNVTPIYPDYSAPTSQGTGLALNEKPFVAFISMNDKPMIAALDLDNLSPVFGQELSDVGDLHSLFAPGKILFDVSTTTDEVLRYDILEGDLINQQVVWRVTDFYKRYSSY